MKNFLISLVVCLCATSASASDYRTIVIPTCIQPGPYTAPTTSSHVGGGSRHTVATTPHQHHTPNCGWIVIRERRPRKVTHYSLPTVPYPVGYGQTPGVTYGGGWAEQRYVEPLVIENPFCKEQ